MTPYIAVVKTFLEWTPHIRPVARTSVDERGKQFSLPAIPSHRDLQQVFDLQMLNVVADVLVVLQVSTFVALVLAQLSIRLYSLARYNLNCKATLTYHLHSL